MSRGKKLTLTLCLPSLSICCDFEYHNRPRFPNSYCGIHLSSVQLSIPKFHGVFAMNWSEKNYWKAPDSFDFTFTLNLGQVMSCNNTKDFTSSVQSKHSGLKPQKCIKSVDLHALSSLIQVTGFLFKRYWISLQILLFQPGLWVKVWHVYYYILVLKISLLLESNDDVIVTYTEGCCVLYSSLVFE